MPIQQITPSEAREILEKNEKIHFVDVRSIPEFERGHPEGAINIPLNHLDQNLRQMVPNPDFLKVFKEIVPQNATVLVSCQAGGRSQQACQILEQVGYENLYNMMGGFGGGRNFETGEPLQGWAAEGLPVSTENGQGVGYESLVK